MPGWYRAGEVDVPDVCRDAVGSGPPDSARVGSFVDPLENAPTVDAHRTREQDVVGGCKEPQCDAVFPRSSVSVVCCVSLVVMVSFVDASMFMCIPQKRGANNRAVNYVTLAL